MLAEIKAANGAKGQPRAGPPVAAAQIPVGTPDTTASPAAAASNARKPPLIDARSKSLTMNTRRDRRGSPGGHAASIVGS